MSDTHASWFKDPKQPKSAKHPKDIPHPTVAKQRKDAKHPKDNYKSMIFTGGFDVNSDEVAIWGGDSANEFITNEKINDFAASRLMRSQMYEDMVVAESITFDKYRDYVIGMWSGFASFNPLAEVSTADIITYVIENSSMKDILWKHLFELINRVSKLHEYIRTDALMHCDAISTTSLDIHHRMDDLVSDPNQLRELINNIITYVNCTKLNGGAHGFKYVDAFDKPRPANKTMAPNSLNTLDEMRAWMEKLTKAEIKVCAWLRELEKYHTAVIIATNGLFDGIDV
jgi:hypothetical protein